MHAFYTAFVTCERHLLRVALDAAPTVPTIVGRYKTSHTKV